MNKTHTHVFLSKVKPIGVQRLSPRPTIPQRPAQISRNDAPESSRGLERLLGPIAHAVLGHRRAFDAQREAQPYRRRRSEVGAGPPLGGVGFGRFNEEILRTLEDSPPLAPRGLRLKYRKCPMPSPNELQNGGAVQVRRSFCPQHHQASPLFGAPKPPNPVAAPNSTAPLGSFCHFMGGLATIRNQTVQNLLQSQKVRILKPKPNLTGGPWLR